jgi:hypothetical protein
LRAGIDDDVRAFFSEPFGDGAANTPGSAGDERNAARKAFFVRHKITG